ncbi:hypothetical protein PJ985_16105 [Streptomyces sp. ACA25]|uniref:hypothetical protein n=1 Tax=Streptomyces sp. ACA25 TaxID=3022596 RepID=UPI00230755E2|nr:hypothetical protein [Streptomyces sp. ACA25]MDB1089085.1 hypothetical protein [Streptomyces sp. ACA25]
MSPRRAPNDLLRGLLREAGWTQERLARAVNTLGGETGLALRYDRTAVAHWLAGTEPRAPVPSLVAEALSRRTGRLVRPETAGFEAATPEPGTQDPVGRFLALSRSTADPHCREPLQRPYRALDAAVPALPARQPARQPGGGPVPHRETVLALHDTARRFAASFNAHGGRPDRSTLSAHLAGEVFPLLRSPGLGPVRRELMTAASRLAFLLARMYQDGLRQGLAQQYFTCAHLLAAEAGDRQTWSVVLRAMSTQAERLGQLPSALRLAEAAAGAAPARPPAQQAYVQAQLAVVLGRVGDRRGALAAISGAEHATERASGAAGPFAAYPEAALHFQVSRALDALGDMSGALAALHRSTAARADTDVRGRALTHARSAELLLRTGRLDEACAAWLRLTHSPVGLRSGEVEDALRRMCRMLHPHRRRRGVAGLLARARARAERVPGGGC